MSGGQVKLLLDTLAWLDSLDCPSDPITLKFDYNNDRHSQNTRSSKEAIHSNVSYFERSYHESNNDYDDPTLDYDQTRRYFHKWRNFVVNRLSNTLKKYFSPSAEELLLQEHNVHKNIKSISKALKIWSRYVKFQQEKRVSELKNSSKVVWHRPIAKRNAIRVWRIFQRNNYYIKLTSLKLWRKRTEQLQPILKIFLFMKKFMLKEVLRKWKTRMLIWPRGNNNFILT